MIIKKLSCKLSAGGSLLVEVSHANDALLSIYKSKSFSKFTYWSAHLFLFTPHTLHLLAKKSGMKLAYVKQIQRYPLSNHIGWLVNGEPGGHKLYDFLDTHELNSSYQSSLAASGVCDTLICEFSA